MTREGMGGLGESLTDAKVDVGLRSMGVRRKGGQDTTRRSHRRLTNDQGNNRC